MQPSNFSAIGWLIQRDITKAITLGAEIFYFGKDTAVGRDRVGYNVGGIFNVSEENTTFFSPEGVTSRETTGYLSISATNRLTGRVRNKIRSK